MQYIVLEVINHSIDSMNGQKFQRYRMKLKEHENIFITDGFTNNLNTCINQGDIIENMQIVGRVSKSQLCEIYYKSKNKNYERQCSDNKDKCYVHKKSINVTVKENEQLSLF